MILKMSLILHATLFHSFQMYGFSFKTPQLSLKAKAIHKFLKMFSPWVKENLCKRNTKAVPRDFMNLKKTDKLFIKQVF